MWCCGCKHVKSNELFTGPKANGKLLKTCIDCRSRISSWVKANPDKVNQSRDPIANSAQSKAWRESERGKQWNLDNKPRVAEQRRAPHRKLKAKVYRSEWKATATGAASIRKTLEKSYKKLWSDPARKLCKIMTNTLGSMITSSKRSKRSKKVLKYTGFHSTSEVAAFFKPKVEALGMTMEQHGKYGWHIAHLIPKVYYDHSDDDDVARCWSQSNMSAQRWYTNLNAGIKIIPSVCASVGADRFPKSWNGMIPTPEQIRVLEVWARGVKV